LGTCQVMGSNHAVGRHFLEFSGNLEAYNTTSMQKFKNSDCPQFVTFASGKLGWSLGYCTRGLHCGFSHAQKHGSMKRNTGFITSF
jgi:hypothetical protein